MASIRKRGNTYYIDVCVGRDSENKKIRKGITYSPQATTPKAIEKEVDAFALEFEKRVKKGEFWDGEKLTFKEVYEDWLKNWASDTDNITVGTKEGYLTVLEKRFIPAFGNHIISTIKAKNINTVLIQMKSEGLSRNTMTRYFHVLNSVMKYAYKNEIIKDNPCDRVDVPKVKDDVPEELHFFEVEQAKKFLDVALTKEYSYKYKSHLRKNAKTGICYEVPEYTQTYKVPEQFRSYFYLSIYGGFRRGELIGLTWENIDFENQTISIVQSVAKTKEGLIIKTPKTKSSYRTITIPKTCVTVLQNWKKSQKRLCLNLGTAWKGLRGSEFDKNYVFINDEGGMMHLDTPSHKFKEILKVYNESCEKEEDKLPIIKLHDLRHTSATLLLASNVDIETVSKRLGHSKASVTLDVYGHATKEKDIVASEILEKVIGGN